MTKQPKTNNHPLKARLFIGGLKSLFGDMHDMLEEVEKTGQMSRDMITSLTDVHEAIDLAVDELKKVMSPCCDHSPDAHQCDDTCNDETTTVPYTGKVVGVEGSPTQSPGGPEAFVIDEDEEDDQEPVEEIQGQGKASWSVCDVCGCDGCCEPDEQRGCDVCGCGCFVEEDATFIPSLKGPSPSDFSSMRMDPEDIPYDSKRHLRVIRHNAPSEIFPTEEDLDYKQDVFEVPTTDKKQPKKKSKTKK